MPAEGDLYLYELCGSYTPTVTFTATILNISKSDRNKDRHQWLGQKSKHLHLFYS